MNPVFVILCIGVFNLSLVIGQGCEQITLDECRPGGCTQTDPFDIPTAQECQDECHHINFFGLCQSFTYNEETQVTINQHFIYRWCTVHCKSVLFLYLSRNVCYTWIVKYQIGPPIVSEQEFQKE